MLPAAEREHSWRLARIDGEVVGHGGGIVELTRTLRVTRPAAQLLERVPGRALDRLYGVVAGRRDLLARFVPDGPAPRIFP